VEQDVDRVIAGPQRKSRMISDREKKIIAYHETGHALVAKFLPDSDPVHKVSIVPRGPALGYTLQLPLEDKYLTTKTEIMNKITVLLGGRSAELLIFNELTTGAQNDLAKATEIAQKIEPSVVPPPYKPYEKPPEIAIENHDHPYIDPKKPAPKGCRDKPLVGKKMRQVSFRLLGAPRAALAACIAARMPRTRRPPIPRA
jgi:hypothetical protein